MIPKGHAFICYRVLAAIHHQVNIAWEQSRRDDALAMCSTIGALQYHMFNAVTTEYALDHQEAA